MDVFGQNDYNELATPPEVDDADIDTGKADFVPNSQFFQKYLSRCYAEVLDSEEIDLNQTVEVQGDEAFRQAIADFMYRFHNVRVKKENIVVHATLELLMLNLLRLPCVRSPSGTKKAEGLLAYSEQVRNTISPCVAMPEDVPLGAEKLVSLASVAVKKIGNDEVGITSDALLTSGATVLFTNALENPPLSVESPEERRQCVLDWANEAPYRYIVEYDTAKTWDLNMTFKSVDEKDKVVYVNSFANLLSLGIPAAWCVLPDNMLAEYREVFGKFSCPLSYLDQLVLKVFLEKGYMDSYLKSLQQGEDGLDM